MKTKLPILLIGALLFNISVVIAQEAQEAHQFNYNHIDATTSSEQSLKDALQKEPLDIKSNFNLAAHYYNQGIETLDNMDYESTFEEKFQVQESVMAQFKQALPLALTVHELDPKEPKTLEMLSGIYFGLNQIEKSQEFAALLEAEK